MRGRFGRLAWLVLATAGASAGCIVPSYHLPAGFSSSYAAPNLRHGSGSASRRRRAGRHRDNPGNLLPGDGVSRSAENLQRSRPASRSPAGPLVLGTDPLSPPPKVAERPPLDIERQLNIAFRWRDAAGSLG